MNPLKNKLLAQAILAACVITSLAVAPQPGQAGNALRERLRAFDNGEGIGDPGERAERQPRLTGKELGVPGASVLTDLAYGTDSKQKIDVYLPPHPDHAPIIVMVHGGAWRFGDKASRNVVENKAAHWLPQGKIFVSVNNRLLPDAKPLDQARDVAAALAFVQKQAASWGGDPSLIVLMGHSAGAHLVALLSSDPSVFAEQGLTPWRGTVALDSAAMNVPRIMQARHHQFYDQAFGDQPDYWRETSPYDRLNPNKAIPMLLVCSSSRRTSCPQAHAFAERVTQQGSTAQVWEEDKTHAEINRDLGLPSPYTARVDAFIEGMVR